MVDKRASPIYRLNRGNEIPKAEQSYQATVALTKWNGMDVYKQRLCPSWAAENKTHKPARQAVVVLKSTKRQNRKWEF